MKNQEENQHLNQSSILPKANEKQITETTPQDARVINQKQLPKKRRLDRKLEENILPQETKKNHNNINHHDSEVNREKILKFSFHKLKYKRKLNFRNYSLNN